MTVPTIGRIVHYMLTQADADAISSRRRDADNHMHTHRSRATGVMVHVGEYAYAGNVFPMLIVKTWGQVEGAAVNGQVMLDGNDCLWVRSVIEGNAMGQYSWPVPK